MGKTIKLNSKWTEYLLKFPESGMGYQLVNIVLHSGKSLEKVVVRNAEEVDSEEKFSVDDIESMVVIL